MASNSSSRGPYSDLDSFQQSFSISAAPETDLYATPKRGYIFTSPIHYRKVPSTSFKSAAVTVNLSYEHLYDQGGLVIVLPVKAQPAPDDTNATEASTHPRWIKCGIEYEEGLPQLSVVEREVWADWSLGLLPPGADNTAEKMASYRIELQRTGNSLLVLAADPGTPDKKRLIRKMQWVFMEDNEHMWIGVYAARPATRDATSGQDLVVNFKDLNIESS